MTTSTIEFPPINRKPAQQPSFEPQVAAKHVEDILNAVPESKRPVVDAALELLSKLSKNVDQALLPERNLRFLLTNSRAVRDGASVTSETATKLVAFARCQESVERLLENSSSYIERAKAALQTVHERPAYSAETVEQMQNVVDSFKEKIFKSLPIQDQRRAHVHNALQIIQELRESLDKSPGEQAANMLCWIAKASKILKEPDVCNIEKLVATVGRIAAVSQYCENFFAACERLSATKN